MRIGPGYKKHIVGVAELSKSIAEELRMPKNKKMLLYYAGLSHDIGKLIVDDLYNETHIGASFLSGIGQEEVSDIIKTHFTVKELIELQLSEDPIKFKEKFPNVNPNDYLPKSLEQKIIAYADLHFSDIPVTFDERIRDIRKRYFANEEHHLFLKSIDKAYDRMYKLCTEINRMRGMRE